VDLPELITNFLAGAAVLGFGFASITALAYWVFKQFGEKWLNVKFSERLKDYKHSQHRELEKLKFSINALMDRTTKLHQHEFEVLPEVWGQLAEAYGATIQFVSPIQQMQNLDGMGESHLSEFLAKCELADWQKEELKEVQDKTTRYAEMIFWHKLNRVWSSYTSFHNYLVKNGVFIQVELKEKLYALSDLLSEAIHERQFEEEHPSPRVGRFPNGERLRKEGKGMLKSIETEVQTRLWNARSLD
jgi:hypothetical protein